MIAAKQLLLVVVIILSSIRAIQPFWFTDSEDNYVSSGDVIDKNDIESAEDTMYHKTDNTDKDICIEEPIETREQKATVIITAKVLDLKPDPNNHNLSIAESQIKRVFKGSDIIAAIDDERPNVNSDDSFNKVISVYGIGEYTICVNSVNKGDTRIFMLNLEYFGNLRISSSIIPISAYTLDKTDAAVKGKP